MGVRAAKPTSHLSQSVTEIIDFGYPQNSEIDTLKTYITTESIMSTASAIVRIPTNLTHTEIVTILQEESSKITTQATGATSWRRADVKYKKNEAFVDVVETVNLSMSAKGNSHHLLQSGVSLRVCIHRHGTTCGRRRAHSHACLLVWYTRMQIRPE